MSDVLILDLGSTIKGNCQIAGFTDKIIISSYSHSVSLPLQADMGNTERTMGRPILSEMTLTKMSDLSTTELYKACTQGSKIGSAKLHVGRVEDGKYMNLFTYEMSNAMIASISTAGGGGAPSDTFYINYTKMKCDFTQQQPDSTAKGTSTWNWNMVTTKAE